MLKKTLVIALYSLFCICSTRIAVLAQCVPLPAIALSSASASITIDDFGDLTAGVTRTGITNVSITAPAACFWDLYTVAVLTQTVQYSPNGILLPLSAIDISAFNFCRTPDHGVPVPPRITGTLAAAFTGPDNYIIGTPNPPNPPDGGITKIGAPCDPPPTTINGTGTASADPTTHTFRIDIRVTPGIAPIIQPGLYDLAIEFRAEDDAVPGVFNALSFNLQIEILPILQLKMHTSDQVDFIFSNISAYTAGITRYGATRLSVNSSLDWDLMAVGTSSLNESTSGVSPFWDQNLSYSAIGTPNILLRVLELHQIPVNPTASGAGIDYSPAFTTPPSGDNYITVGSQGLLGVITFTTVPPPPANRTIAGDWGDPVTGMPPGSYLPGSGGGPEADHLYTISYRITPGLPVTFNGLMGEAQPGSYTMQIRYLLSVDQ
ncbi:MAG: hypothetical protein JKX73_03805 [Flavobacteriales bacterium]|nr:hypothetical protein [Flavobacteriales bacterium]